MYKLLSRILIYFILMFSVIESSEIIDYNGALFIDNNLGIVVVSYDIDDLNKAEKYALYDCISKGGKNCEKVVTFKNSCASIAWSIKTKYNGYALSKVGLDEAEDEAMKQCKSNGGLDCEIKASVCTSWDIIP